MLFTIFHIRTKVSVFIEKEKRVFEKEKRVFEKNTRGVYGPNSNIIYLFRLAIKKRDAFKKKRDAVIEKRVFEKNTRGCIWSWLVCVS